MAHPPQMLRRRQRSQQSVSGALEQVATLATVVPEPTVKMKKQPALIPNFTARQKRGVDECRRPPNKAPKNGPPVTGLHHLGWVCTHTAFEGRSRAAILLRVRDGRDRSTRAHGTRPPNRTQSFAALWLLMNSHGSAGAEGAGLPRNASLVDHQ